MITVLLPTYNAEKYIAEAIESILNQTFRDFELLIINDGSTDKSPKIIQSYNDKRIKLFNNTQNLGLVPTLNKGLNLIKSKYIVRMDADDVSLPTRLEKLYNFMENNPKIDICGTWVEIFGENTQKKVWKIPAQHQHIQSRLLFEVSLAHPSIIIKTDFFKRNSLYYDINYRQAQDFELWTRIHQKATFANIPEVLYKVRSHNKKVSVLYNNKQFKNAQKIILKQIRQLGIEPSEKERQIHHEVVNRPQHLDLNYLKNVENWLTKLKQANKKKKVYPEPVFTEVLSEVWLKNFAGNSHFGLKYRAIFKKSIFSGYKNYSTWQKLKFFVKTFFKYS